MHPHAVSDRLQVLVTRSQELCIQRNAGLDHLLASVYVIRNTGTGPEIYRLDASSADAMLLANHFAMRPRDVVYVAATELTGWNRFIQQVLPTIQTIFAPTESIF